ncbi:hypothetical protein IAD21_05267 [Abditibacteriota bacterium]|nr:hypothetical protein IAD21_05267 [Abditibacteriota bacterium]
MKSVFSVAACSAVLALAFAVNAGADSSRRDLHKNLKFDLDGDGKPDTIALKIGKEENKFQLTINGVTASGELLDTVEGFYLANINRADPSFEVVVYTPGPSDDDEHLVYWYDGKSIHQLAHLERWVNYRGDGTLSVTSWAGFWQPKDEWFLTPSHELRQKPRMFYPVNVKATTTKATPLHASIGSKTVSMVPTKRTALIVKSNPARSWYYVKAGNKSGWLSEAELYDHLTGMPVAD